MSAASCESPARSASSAAVRATTTSAPRAPSADSRSIATPTSSSTTSTRVPASTAGARRRHAARPGAPAPTRGHRTRKHAPAPSVVRARDRAPRLPHAPRRARDSDPTPAPPSRLVAPSKIRVLLPRRDARSLVAHGDPTPRRVARRARRCTWLSGGAHASAFIKMLVSTCDASAASGKRNPRAASVARRARRAARCASTERASTTSPTTVSSVLLALVDRRPRLPMARRARSRAERARSSMMASARSSSAGDAATCAGLGHPAEQHRQRVGDVVQRTRDVPVRIPRRAARSNAPDGARLPRLAAPEAKYAICRVPVTSSTSRQRRTCVAEGA